jgi:hypothetical protein
MIIIDLQDVRIEQILNLQHPNQKEFILSYLNHQYVSIQIFPIDRLDSAQNLWRHLTTDRSQNCLIVKERDRYSVWVENTRASSVISNSPDLELGLVFQTQLCLIDGLWGEVRELLGQNQAAAFGREILSSIPTISSIEELTIAIEIATRSAKGSVQSPEPKILAYLISERQSVLLYREIQQLGSKYLGKNYTKELLLDLQQQLSPQLQSILRNWQIEQHQ